MQFIFEHKLCLNLNDLFIDGLLSFAIFHFVVHILLLLTDVFLGSVHPLDFTSFHFSNPATAVITQVLLYIIVTFTMKISK